jgi:murein L,D-transpeptidase YafK
VIESWRDAWQSLDTARYLTNYSQAFHSGNMDYRRWSEHKQRVNAQKSFIDLKLDNISVYTYPGKPDLRVVTFQQDYKSDNHQQVSAKQQYWQREADGVWRIVFEGPAS